MSTTESIGLLVLFLLISFLLSGLESAILSVSKVRLRHAAKKKRRGAAMLDRTLKGSERLLIAILLLNAITNIGAFALVTRVLVDWLGTPAGYLVAFVVSLPFYIIWVELTPKYLFNQFPLRSLILFNPFLRTVQLTICPLLALLAWVPNLLVRLFTKAKEITPRGATREEFKALTSVFRREGTLEHEEARLIRQVIDFQNVKVNDLMIPLSKTTAVPPDMPVSAALALSSETRFDEFPVMSTTGDLIGIISITKLLQLSAPSGTVEQYRSAITRTSPNDGAFSVIKRLRNSGHKLAAVYGEDDELLGVISNSDMIQSMLGNR